jgi:hypothetical protein
MGHERVGALPRTREWRALVQQIADTAEAPETVPTVAAGTLLKVRQRFDGIPADRGFQAAFGFILGLVTHQPPAQTGEDVAPAVDLTSDPSALRLTAQMCSWVDAHAESLEYAELAKRAAADVIAFWTRERSKQADLFGPAEAASRLWAGAHNAGAFSDLCRVFFGKFTERYIKYFLDREASAQLPSVEARVRFAASLERHVEAIARHSFETTNIAQSFAAGWYNKHARRARPDRQAVVAFLSFAMGKLREELLRESATR